jgi:phosphoribosylformylglycinamidine synthase
MALNCCDEAVRNLLCVGADINKTAFLDNFCWGSPENKILMGALVLTAKGCYDGALAYGAPFISGKDSFYNQSKDAGGRDLPIPSTILISATAPVYDIRKAITMDFKQAGNAIYIVGITKDELGGSVAGKILDLKNTFVTGVDGKTAFKNYQKIYKAMQNGLVQTAHDISQGGLAAALAEMCFSGGLGAKVDLSKLLCASKLDAAQKLFSESASRIILEVAPQGEKEFKKIMSGAKFAKIGVVSESQKLEIFESRHCEEPQATTQSRINKKAITLDCRACKKPQARNDGALLSEPIPALKKSWQSTEII